MKYLFLISWLRAREKKLADNIDVDRMVSASSVEESFKVLNDTDYAPFIAGESYKSIDKVIEKEHHDLRKSLSLMDIEKEAVDILFLRDEFSEVAKTLKKDLFGNKGKQKQIAEKRKESDITKEVKERKPQKPHEVDEILDNIYFERMIAFLEKSKENYLTEFFKEYEQVVKDNNNSENVLRDEILKEMEEQIIEKESKESDGFLPVLAFFIKKRRAEYIIRTILSAKRIGIETKEINNLINKVNTI